MYQQNDMKEVQMILVRNNNLDQYTTYNFPLLNRVTSQHMRYLRIFEQMQSRYLAQVQQLATTGKTDEKQASQLLLSLRKKKKNQEIDVVAKQVYQDFSFAIVNYEHPASNKDLTLFLVYDQRVNN